MRKVPAKAYTPLVLASILILVSSCSKKDDPLVITPTVNPIQYSIVAYMITPPDKKFNSDYYRGARDAMLDLQEWYKSQLNGKTFVLNPVVIDTLTGIHNSDWFNLDHGDSISGNYNIPCYYNTKYELKQLLGSKFDTAQYTYFVFVQANFPDETIPKGLAAEGLDNLKGLAGDSPNGSRGADGHALAHALGLPEPATESSDGIMSNGYPKYPNCVFTQEEKDSLNASPFIKLQ
jgi:hypothetical protein